jgi:OOP family OmpA-OmpF porin
MNHGLVGWRATGALWLGLAVAPALHAQGQPVPQDVIANESLTPVAVLEALDPTAVRARSLRIGATGKSAVPPRASASLLVTFETNSSELTSAARRQLDIV